MSAAGGTPGAAEALKEEFAAWGRSAGAWLDRVDRCIAGSLQPQDVATLRRDCDRLADELAKLGARWRRLGPAAGGRLPLDVDALVRRLGTSQIPPLGDRILAQFPAPGAAGLEPEPPAGFNLAAAADLLALLEQASARLFNRPVEPARRQRLTRQLAELGERYHRQVMDGFAALERGDEHGGLAAHPERAVAARDSLRIANYNQIRMDMLDWLLDALGYAEGAERIRHLSRITARTAVRRVDLDLQAYLASQAPETRVRLRPVLESVDEVLALVRAVLQQSEDHLSSGMNHFVSDLGAETAEPFIQHMGMLVIALFEDLQSAAETCRLTPAALGGALHRIDEVLLFCRRVEHPLGRDALARALRVVRSRSDGLTAALERCLNEVPGSQQAVDARAALTVLRDFVDRHRADAVPKEAEEKK